MNQTQRANAASHLVLDMRKSELNRIFELRDVLNPHNLSHSGNRIETAPPWKCVTALFEKKTAQIHVIFDKPFAVRSS